MIFEIPAALEIADVSAYTEQVATELLQQMNLVMIGGNSEAHYSIDQVEIYLQSAEHQDPYCHPRPIIAHESQWYFHRAGRHSEPDPKRRKTDAGGYRGGTRKGLDITFGNDDIRCGILIRGITRLKSESSPAKAIFGPSRVVDEILSQFSAHNTRNLVEDLWKEDVATECGKAHRTARMFLQSCKREKREIFKGPRVGLTYKTSAEHVRYFDTDYRYFSLPQSTNTRIYDFVAIYRSRNFGNQPKENAVADISKLLGIREANVENLIDEFKLGQSKTRTDLTTADGLKLVHLYGTLQGSNPSEVDNHTSP